MSYNNQLPVVQQYLINIAATYSVGVLQLIWLCEIMGGMLLMWQNTTMRVYGARIICLFPNLHKLEKMYIFI